MTRSSLGLLVYAATLAAQSVPANLGLDEGEPGQVPVGWSSPRYLAELRREGCYAGTGCAVIFRPDNRAPNSFSNLAQRLDATPYRGKKVIFRAAVRVEPLDAEGRGQLWFRVDRPNQEIGFFDNMGNRPIRSGEWKIYEIAADVDKDASFINFGALALGDARVWLDAVSLEVTEPLEADASVRDEIGKIYALLDAAAGKTDVLLSVALPDAVAGSPMQKVPLAEWLKQWDSIREPGVKYTSKSEIVGVSVAGSEATVRIRQSATTTRDGATRATAAATTDKWVRRDRDWKLKESLMTSYREVEPPTDPESAKRVVAELKQSVAPLTTAEAGKPYPDLAAFGKAAGDARIVALGEATHGTREIFQMKHRLLEYLVKEKGFTVFAIEANWPESEALDRYVKTGVGDPKAGLRDMYFWTWQTEEVLAMVEWMRAYNKEAGARPKLSFTSFDMQTYKVAMEKVVEYVKAHASSDVAAVESAYAKLRELVESRQFPEPRFKEASPGAKRVVELLESRRDALTKASSAAAYRDALQAARIVVQASEVRTPGAAGSYRDQMMAKNVEWLANEAFPGEKIVLWAHNGHVRADGSEGYRPMGSWLRNAYGDKMYVLGFAIHKGEVRASTWENGRAIGVRPSPVPAAPEGSGSAVLSAAGRPIFFLNMKSLADAGALRGWLDERHLFRECGAVWKRDDAVNDNMRSQALSRSYDGLIFFEESHAARGLN